METEKLSLLVEEIHKRAEYLSPGSSWTLRKPRSDRKYPEKLHDGRLAFGQVKRATLKESVEYSWYATYNSALAPTDFDEAIEAIHDHLVSEQKKDRENSNDESYTTKIENLQYAEEVFLDHFEVNADGSGVLRKELGILIAIDATLGEPIRASDMVEYWQLICENVMAQGRQLPFKETVLKQLYKKIVTAVNKQEKDTIVSELAYVAYPEGVKHPGETALEDVLEKGLRVEHPLDAKRAIMHLLWAIKRKMAGLPVRDKIMPVLTGGQGVGKTYLIEAIVQPLKELVAKATTTNIGDRMAYLENLAVNHYVVMFEEIGGIDGKQLGVLKDLVTSNTINWRKSGGDTKDTGRNIASFIGSTNDRLGDIVTDHGNRRFYEIFSPVLDKTSAFFCRESDAVWGKGDILGTAWTQIWQSVDVSVPYGYFDPKKKDVASRMAGAVEKTRADSFIKTNRLMYYSDYTGTEIVEWGDIIDDYTDYCKTHKPGAEKAQRQLENALRRVEAEHKGNVKLSLGTVGFYKGKDTTSHCRVPTVNTMVSSETVMDMAIGVDWFRAVFSEEDYKTKNIFLKDNDRRVITVFSIQNTLSPEEATKVAMRLGWVRVSVEDIETQINNKEVYICSNEEAKPYVLQKLHEEV